MKIIDPNHNGLVSYAEFMQSFGSIAGGKDDSGLDKKLIGIGSHEKELAKYLRPQSLPSWTAERIWKELGPRLSLNHRSVRSAFRKYDGDASGDIALSEFRRMLLDLNIGVNDVEFKKLAQKVGVSAIEGARCIKYADFNRAFGGAISGERDTGDLTAQALMNTGLSIGDRSSAQKKHVAKALNVNVRQAGQLIGEKMALNAKSVRRIFRKYDKDFSGELDYNEFRRMLRDFNLELPDTVFQDLMTKLDQQKCGVVSYHDFTEHFGKFIVGSGDGTGGLSAMLQRRDEKEHARLQILKARARSESPGVEYVVHQDEPRIADHPQWEVKAVKRVLQDKLALASNSVRAAFRSFDSDASGSLDHSEFRNVLRKFNIEMNDENFFKVMKALDPSGDGEINYNEFLQSFGQSIAGAGDTNGLSSQLQNSQGKNSRVSLASSGGARNTQSRLPSWTPLEVKKTVSDKMSNRFDSVTAAFRELDKDKSGHLSLKELWELLRNFNIELSDQDFKEVLRAFRVPDSGLKFSDFLDRFGVDIAGANDSSSTWKVLQAAESKSEGGSVYGDLSSVGSESARSRPATASSLVSSRLRTAQERDNRFRRHGSQSATLSEANLKHHTKAMSDSPGQGTHSAPRARSTSSVSSWSSMSSGSSGRIQSASRSRPATASLRTIPERCKLSRSLGTLSRGQLRKNTSSRPHTATASASSTKHRRNLSVGSKKSSTTRSRRPSSASLGPTPAANLRERRAKALARHRMRSGKSKSDGGTSDLKPRRRPKSTVQPTLRRSQTTSLRRFPHQLLNEAKLRQRMRNRRKFQQVAAGLAAKKRVYWQE